MMRAYAFFAGASLSLSLWLKLIRWCTQ